MAENPALQIVIEKIAQSRPLFGLAQQMAENPAFLEATRSIANLTAHMSLPNGNRGVTPRSDAG